MLFNSKVFIVFGLVVYGLYYALNDRGRLWLLLVASYVFYGFWDPTLCSLIALSTVVDFLCGRNIAATDVKSIRKRWLGLSLAVNLGMLGVFKYYDFFVSEAAHALNMVGYAADADSWMLNLMLPVGISFYTFQTMSYTIDIYRKDIEPEPSLLRFAIYVAFFPQLVAGPVERAQHLLPQFRRPFRMSRQMVKEGVFFILLGFVKKTVVADRLALWIEPYYERLADNGPEAAIAMLLFTTQIYVDFSSYSDIAIGLGLLLGYHIRANFNLPFVVPSIPERWRRWHISMSHWFRDYIFIPLGGSRKGVVRTQINIMAVMFLSGLWHGASNNFVMWGLLNGLTMVSHKLLLRPLRFLSGNAERSWLTKWVYYYICCFVTYCTIASINIFFRTPDWETAKSFVAAIYTSGGQWMEWATTWNVTPEKLQYGIAWTLVVFFIHELQRWGGIKEKILSSWTRWGVVSLAMFFTIVLFGIAGPEFIYYQF